MMKHQNLKRHVLGSVVAGTLLASAGAALAGDMTLFSFRDYKGEAMTIRGPAPSLERIGNNETAASIVVREGVWELCTQPQFTGRCIQVQPGEYSSLGLGPDSRFASVREITGNTNVTTAPATTYTLPSQTIVTTPPQAIVTTPPPTVATLPPPPVSSLPAPSANDAVPKIVLYERDRFRGRSIELSQTDSDLGRFGNRADSAVVVSGIWRLCERPSGGGDCIEVGPGRYETLGTLDNRIRSAEVVAGAGAPAPSEGRAILYQHPNFRGRAVVVTQSEMPQLDAAFLDSGAKSIRVESGRWVFCSNVNYAGECRTFVPGEYARLPWEVDRVASGHQLPERYSSLR